MKTGDCFVQLAANTETMDEPRIFFERRTRSRE